MVPKQGLWVRVGVREGGNYVVLLIGVLGHGGDEVSCVGGGDTEMQCLGGPHTLYNELQVLVMVFYFFLFFLSRRVEVVYILHEI